MMVYIFLIIQFLIIPSMLISSDDDYHKFTISKQNPIVVWAQFDQKKPQQPFIYSEESAATYLFRDIIIAQKRNDLGKIGAIPVSSDTN